MSIKEAFQTAGVLANMDSATIRQVVGFLVSANHQTADTLQFAINTELHELMLRNGFSEKINSSDIG